MASSLRTTTRLLRQAAKLEGQRYFSSGRYVKSSHVRPLVLGSVLIGGGALAYKTYRDTVTSFESCLELMTAHAASVPESQPSVYSGTKEHALYLWIHLRPEANVKQCAKVVANMTKHVDAVCPPDLRDESDEIIAGVGFGPEFWYKIWGKTRKDYSYAYRSGNLGDMPSSGGDIFIHAKSDTYSKLFELTQKIVAELPAGSVDRCEDIYGWVYKNGRDLSGFIDGTENPADDEHRQQVAVEKETGGSYCITQKWLHRMDIINTQKESVLEGWVGRTYEDSMEIKRKSISSHVARMTGGNAFEQKKVFEIVRQSQPFGSLTGDHGLFFIGYSESPENFNYMLDRMVGRRDDKHCDDIMRLSLNTKGTYWYFPSAKELKKLS